MATVLLMLAILTLPALVFGLMWSLFPSPDETPRWRVRVAAALERAAERVHPERPTPPDPFAALLVQQRLGAVAQHVQTLEGDPHAFARAERIIAGTLAYDQLLAEACRLAGVEIRDAASGDPQERFREEVELASRGWTW